MHAGCSLSCFSWQKQKKPQDLPRMLVRARRQQSKGFCRWTKKKPGKLISQKSLLKHPKASTRTPLLLLQHAEAT